MRIRSVLAATVLGIALAAAGTTTATADEGAGYHHSGHRHSFGDDKGNCSPYIGAIKTSSAGIFWAGEHCHII
ncbi:hypothetical protein [Streptomyces soliscabiei]|uniref:hypothetical protein n=1 Tax=Streptomyces soliscabiei TaxID=588897 RepID=UPI0029B25E54|nr:hypothetical protein [Streptomyces sp. NY05-11A]MDX2678574.1 hypothetical protein [Streptomyces sp. NY05-11A]